MAGKVQYLNVQFMVCNRGRAGWDGARGMALM